MLEKIDFGVCGGNQEGLRVVCTTIASLTLTGSSEARVLNVPQNLG